MLGYRGFKALTLMAGGGIQTEIVNLEYRLNEHHIYGSSRLGIHKSDSLFCEFPIDHYYNAFYNSWEPVLYNAMCAPSGSPSTYTEHKRLRGKRFYELTNHLGNVLMTVTDRKLPIDLTQNQQVDYFEADIASANDFYPFGMMEVNRGYSFSDYRFGFQNQEKDDEIFGSTGSFISFKYRGYDSRLGRFWSVDPLAAKYPSNSTYAFAENRVIDGRELEGLEWQPVNDQGENVATDADNIASYNWVGYNYGYIYNGQGYASMSDIPTPASPDAITQGYYTPAGTVAEGSIWTGTNSMRFYSSSGTPNAVETNGTITNVAITDQVTIDRIGTLHPDIRNTAREILIRSEYENGQRLRLTTGFRDQATQNSLYSQNRTQAQVNAATDAWGTSLTGVVAQPNAAWATNSTWGKSYHNYGLAIDVVGYNNNQIQWNINWNAYHTLGQRFGGTTVAGDNPHLTLNLGNHWNTLKDLPTDANGYRILPGN